MDISKIDVDIAIESMKNDKLSGPDTISIEPIKCGGDRLKERIWHLIDRVVQCCKTPKEWKISHISSIYKKGDRRDPKIYRYLKQIITKETIKRLHWETRWKSK